LLSPTSPWTGRRDGSSSSPSTSTSTAAAARPITSSTHYSKLPPQSVPPPKLFSLVNYARREPCRRRRRGLLRSSSAATDAATRTSCSPMRSSSFVEVLHGGAVPSSLSAFPGSDAWDTGRIIIVSTVFLLSANLCLSRSRGERTPSSSCGPRRRCRRKTSVCRAAPPIVRRNRCRRRRPS